jgi:hypothetical protein
MKGAQLRSAGFEDSEISYLARSLGQPTFLLVKSMIDQVVGED